MKDALKSAVGRPRSLMSRDQDDGTVSSPFQTDVPDVDLFSFIQPTLTRFADKQAVVELFGAKRSLTYRELDLWSEAIAGQFYACGLRKHRNDRLAIYSPNSIEYELVIMASQRLGLTLVSVNYMSTADELRHCLLLTECVALVTAECVAVNALKAASETASVQTVFVIGQHSKVQHGVQSHKVVSLIGQPPSHTDRSFPAMTSHSLPPEVQKASIDAVNDAALILFSSGTTGLPKAVAISHANMVTIQMGFRHEAFAINSEYRLVYQPMSHIYGIGVTIETLSTGATLLLQSKFNLHDYLTAVSSYKLSTLHIVPPIATMLAKTDLSRYDLSAVDTVIVASAPLSSPVEAEVLQKIGNPNVKIAQTYGLTESTGIITMTPYSLTADRRHAFNLATPPPAGTCGLLYVNTEAKIIDVLTGKILGPNEDGEILARGPQLMLKYFKNETATAGTIDADGWLHTGDIGHYDQNGYFFIVDRAKELIKYKGFQVAPAELEAVILQHPEILDVGVIGIPDSAAGELPQAWVVRKPSSALVEKDVINWVAERSAPYKWLRGGVRFVDNIPRSPTGKILRRVMKQQQLESRAKL